MVMNVHNLINEIKEEMKNLIEIYKEKPAIILTEDDLKLHVIYKLNQINELSFNNLYSNSNKNINGTYLHSEIYWFDNEGKLVMRPDISIIDPKNIIIQGSTPSNFDLSKNSFIFNGKSIIFELKFIDIKSGITKSKYDLIEKDYEKIKKLLEINGNNLFAFMIIFNKSDKKIKEFEDLRNKINQTQNISLIYGSADMKF